MAQRRERPPLAHSGDSLKIRLPGGRTLSMPVSASAGPAASEVCCFCGQGVEQADPEQILIDVRWGEDGNEHKESLGAHRRCLLERMHDQVKAQGPFFGG